MNDNIKLPPMPKPHTPPVFATAANTPSVKAGYELGGYEKTPPLFDEHQLEAYAREAVRLNATVPAWVPVTQQLLDSQEPWLYKTCWLAFPSGAVLTGVYEWRQGRNPDRFISAEVGDVWAFDVSHVMPVTPPPHPDMLSAAPAAPPPAQPLTDEQIKRIMLDNGFTIKEGLTDLKPYVYAAARALIAAATGVKND